MIVTAFPVWLVTEDPNFQAMAASVIAMGAILTVFALSTAIRAQSHGFGFCLVVLLLPQAGFFMLGIGGILGSFVVGSAQWTDKGWVQLAYGLTLVFVNAVAAAVFLRGLRPGSGYAEQLHQTTASRREVEWVLMWCLPISAAIPVVLLLPESVGTLVKTFSFQATFIPFFVGRFVHRRSPIFWAWIAFLAINALLGMLQGGRFNAFFPVLMFLVGFRGTLNPASRRFTDSIALAGFFPAVLIIGALGLVRNELGRDSRDNLTSAHAVRLADSFGQIATARSEDVTLAMLTDGASRLIPWSNYAVPLLSPDSIPYRGFESFPAEVVNSLMIYRFSDDARGKLFSLNMHALVANDYGFAVQEGFAVDWGVLADGWSRGGWLGGVAFLFIGCSLIYALERWLIATRTLRPAFKMVLHAVILGRLLVVDTIPLLELIRQTLLAVLLYFLILLVVQKFIVTSSRR